MRLAEQWEETRGRLGLGWARADLALSVDPADADRAALVLGPAATRRNERGFRLVVVRESEGVGLTPTALERMLARLDGEGIAGTLELDSGTTGGVAPASLAGTWDLLTERLPEDWSHLYAEVELESSDFVERGALLLAPANPSRFGSRTTLRFRCANRVGYGVAAPMARRCLERLDAERITGRVRIVRVVSDDRPVGTQGPVWRVAGRPV